MSKPRILGISGNVRAPSRTSALVADVLGRIGETYDADIEHLDLGIKAPVLFRALRSDQLDDEGLALVKSVEEADVLVVGSPVYRASYSGALKHLFDLVHYESLIGKPVVLLATGGSPLHGLMIDHQLRPLFAFFKAQSLASGVYALESDFSAYSINNPALLDRIETTVSDLGRLALASGQPLSRRQTHSQTAASAA